jgi:hypothetical protein
MNHSAGAAWSGDEEAGPTRAGDGIGTAALGDLSKELAPAVEKDVLAKGDEFARAVGAGPDSPVPCLLISGQFGTYEDDGSKLYENRVKQSLLDALGYPDPDPDARLPRIAVLLDSGGGMLDSAFKIVLYLLRYAKELHVYVPRRAKSASTLVALGARCVHLSPFGALGPLDTQIEDPRFAKHTVSALDFYQSVDYVRNFAFGTMEEALERLRRKVGTQVSQPEILTMACDFALRTVAPMMQSVEALDFGGWGRSLKIGEKYAELLLRRNGKDEAEAKAISAQLVYGFTHHRYDIDHREAVEMGLPAELMDRTAYERAEAVVALCKNKAFVGFISQAEARAEAKARAGRQEEHDRRDRRGPGGLDDLQDDGASGSPAAEGNVDSPD